MCVYHSTVCIRLCGLEGNVATILGGSVADAYDDVTPSSCAPDPWWLNCARVLRQMREAAGLTLDELGTEVDYSESHMSHIETARSRPRLDQLFKLWRRLKITPGFPFEPALSPEDVETIVLFMRATGAVRKLVRDMLVIYDSDTRAAQQSQESTSEQCA